MDKPKLNTLKQDQILINFQDQPIRLTRRNGKKFEKVTIRLSDLIEKYSALSLFKNDIFKNAKS